MSGELFRVLTHSELGCRDWSPEARSKFKEIMLKIFDIENAVQKYNLTTKVNSKYGKHYRECCWSNDDTGCGPGDCVCSQISRNKYHISVLLDELVVLVRAGDPFDW